MKTWMVAVIAAGCAASAADAPGIALYKAAELRGIARALTPKLKDGLATEALANMGNYSFVRVLRTASGQAEVHEVMADIFVIETGQATLVTGGTVQEPKNTAPHETRGSGIAGGKESKLAAGDIVTIPAKMPHLMKVDAGQQVTYLAVKVAQ